VRGHRGNAAVRAALIRYSRWLRKQYDFPRRVPVYLFPSETIITQDGAHVSASFFAPNNRRFSPFIRIATGDFEKLRRKRGRDNALAAFILSMSHEIVHYHQWLSGMPFSERSASARARAMLRRYAREVDHP
jgi:hypothetical protein